MDDLCCLVDPVGSWAGVRSSAERLYSSAAAHCSCGGVDPNHSGAANPLASVTQCASRRCLLNLVLFRQGAGASSATSSFGLEADFTALLFVALDSGLHHVDSGRF